MVLATHPGFYVGSLFIYYYGLVYAFAALGLYLVLLKRRKRLGLADTEVDTLIISILLGLIVGARIFHFLINDPAVFIRDPIELLRIRDGGMSFFGAFIGIVSGAFIWYRLLLRRRMHARSVGKKTDAAPFGRQNLLMILDTGAFVACVALIFGRIANFLNQELVGRLADPNMVPWCVNFATAAGCRHPYQLYAAISHLILALILLVLILRRARAGIVFFSFMTGYGIFRFITDFWREDPILALGLTAWQFFAIAIAIIGSILLWREIAKNHPEPGSRKH